MLQTQSSINPALGALLQTAQMVTPDQTPTVAAQVAQAAQQKMQPQGIMQGIPKGMPQATQDFRTAAQIDNMKRMQMQQAMQQMAQQAMQPQSDGIAALPGADVQVAEGGVVGYDGRDESLVKSQVEEILRKAPMARTPEENAILRASGIELTQRPMGDASGIMALDKFLRSPFLREAFTGGAHKLTTEELKQRGDTAAITEKIFRMFGGDKSSTESQPTATPATASTELPQASYDHEGRVGLASKPVASPMQTTAMPSGAPVVRPAVTQQPAAASNVPTGGIASAIERPSFESVMQGVRMAMGQDDQYENKMRDIARREEAKRAGMPDLNAQGIAALQEAERQRQADLQRGKFYSLFEGWKGNTAAYGNFKEASRQAELQNKMAIMKFQEAQQARELGEFDRAKALEKEVQAHKDKQSQIEQHLATASASLAGHLYSADVQERTAELNRKAQAALRSLPTYEQQNAERAIKDWLAKNPGKTFSDAWEWFRGAGKPDRTVMTYDQAADNVSKFLDTTSGIMEVASIKKRATDAGQPEPSLSQIRDMLIQRELQSAGGRSAASAAPTAPTQLPPGVKVTRVGP